MLSYAVETLVDPFPMVPAFADSLMNAIAEGNIANAEFLPEIPWSVDPVQPVLPARFSANRKSLVNRLKQVSRFSPRRSPRPILQTVQLSVNGTVALTATDNESWITTRDDYDRAGDRIVLVNPDALTGCLKSLKDATVECDVQADELIVRGSAGELSIPLERFPMHEGIDEQGKPCGKLVDTPMPESKEPDCQYVFTVRACDLLQAIEQTHYATDTESTRYAFGGLSFDIDAGGVLRLVGTDTRRLSTCKVDTLPEFSQEQLAEFCKIPHVVPVGFLRKLTPFLESLGTDDVTIGFSENHVTICAIQDGHSWQAVSMLMAGRFPNWRDVVPQYPMREIAMKKSDFIAALELASVATNEASRGVDFLIPETDGEITLVMSAKSAETGRKSSGKCSAAQVKVNRDIVKEDENGNPIPFGSICFDPRYIMEYLGNLPKSAEYVQIALTDHEGPGVLTANGIDGQYITMPLSRGK